MILAPGCAGRVLVRLPSWLGDVVAVEPAASALARAVGEERLSLAAPAHLLPLLDAWLPRARRIEHARRGGERAASWRGHDLAVLFTGSFRSAWTAWRAGIRTRVGWVRDGRGLFLTHGMSPPFERGGVPIGLGVPGAGRRYLPRPVSTSAIELVGVLGVPTARTVARLPLVERAVERVERAFGGERGLLLNVGGRAGSAKAWSVDAWVETCMALAERGAPRPWLVCGPGEEGRLEAIARSLRSQGLDHALAFDEAPADLPELAALCARAAAVVTMDSGPRHVARAVGAPTVTLFGPTDPRHTLAAGPPERRLRVEVECGPCHREQCLLPEPQAHRCTARLTPESVAQAVLSLLAADANG
ncbi:MAG: glycosyltransferase family 9 protein [Planctomycetota bacterium]